MIRSRPRFMTANAQVALYLGRQEYWIMRDRTLKPCAKDEPSKCNIAILGREYYSEVVESLPMTSTEELKAAISFSAEEYFPEALSSAAANLFFMRRLRVTDSGSEVNIWTLEQSILKRLKQLSPLWIIPETALIGYHHKTCDSRQLWEIERPDGSLLLVGREPDGGLKSVLNYDQTPDIVSLARVLGGEFPQAKEQFDRQQWVDYLCTGLLEGQKNRASLFIRMLLKRQNFWNRAGWEKRFGNLRRHLGTAIAVLVIFSLFSGAQLLLPWYLNRGVAARINQLKPTVDQVLEQKNELKRRKAEIGAVAGALEQAGSRMALFALISNCFPEKGRLNRIHSVGNQVEISGLAPDAGAYLKALSNDPRVKSARFKSPVRSDRRSKMEKFNLTFLFIIEQDEPQ